MRIKSTNRNICVCERLVSLCKAIYTCMKISLFISKSLSCAEKEKSNMVDRVFKSKIGWWYHLTVWVMAACTVLTFVKSNNIIGMIFLLLMTLFFIHSMLTTWYKITADGWLIAHSSFFPEKRVRIEEITAVEVTVMPISSYALSLDRLIIYKNGMQWMLISPENKQEFVKLLRRHNPEIRIKDPIL